MKRTAEEARRNVSKRIWSVLFARLAQRAQEQDSALHALASSGRTVRRNDGPSRREQREAWSQVCAACGRGLPPGRPGRTCEACRKPCPTQAPNAAKPIPA